MTQQLDAVASRARASLSSQCGHANEREPTLSQLLDTESIDVFCPTD
jgi:hypothetical protein